MGGGDGCCRFGLASISLLGTGFIVFPGHAYLFLGEIQTQGPASGPLARNANNHNQKNAVSLFTAVTFLHEENVFYRLLPPCPSHSLPLYLVRVQSVPGLRGTEQCMLDLAPMSRLAS